MLYWLQCSPTITKIRGGPQTSFTTYFSVSFSHSSSHPSPPVLATRSSAATPFGSDPSSPFSPALPKRPPIISDSSNPPVPLPRTLLLISSVLSLLISCYRSYHFGSRVDPRRIRISSDGFLWFERAIGSELMVGSGVFRRVFAWWGWLGCLKALRPWFRCLNHELGSTRWRSAGSVGKWVRMVSGVEHFVRVVWVVEEAESLFGCWESVGKEKKVEFQIGTKGSTFKWRNYKRCWVMWE